MRSIHVRQETSSVGDPLAPSELREARAPHRTARASDLFHRDWTEVPLELAKGPSAN